MFNFEPKELACEIKDVESSVNNQINTIEKIRSAMKLYSVLYNNVEVEKVFSNRDLIYQIDILAEHFIELEHHTATLRAQVAYLIEQFST